MTIATTNSKSTGLGNGATTVFNFTFLLQSTAQMVVTYVDALNNSTVLLPGSYTVTFTPGVAGGTVIYNPGGIPIATGTKLTMQRILTFQQLTNLRNQGSYNPAVVEATLDYLTMLAQQLNDIISGGPVPQFYPSTSLNQDAVVLTSGVAGLITSPGAIWDDGGWFDGVSRITVPVAGRYLLQALGGVFAGSGTMLMTIKKNGLSFLTAQGQGPDDIPINLQVNLSANDYLQMYFTQSSGGNQTFSNNRSYFQLSRIK